MFIYKFKIFPVLVTKFVLYYRLKHIIFFLNIKTKDKKTSVENKKINKKGRNGHLYMEEKQTIIEYKNVNSLIQKGIHLFRTVGTLMNSL